MNNGNIVQCKQSASMFEEQRKWIFAVIVKFLWRHYITQSAARTRHTKTAGARVNCGARVLIKSMVVLHNWKCPGRGVKDWRRIPLSWNMVTWTGRGSVAWGSFPRWKASYKRGFPCLLHQQKPPRGAHKRVATFALSVSAFLIKRHVFIISTNIKVNVFI